MTTMTMQASPPFPWIRAALFILSIISLFIAGTFYTSRYLSDGTDGPVPGGPLKTGELQDLATVQWPNLLGETGQCEGQTCAPQTSVELNLLATGWTRTTGMLVRDGILYIPCDLGFMWGRFDGQQRYILHAIYLLKRWHLDALDNGDAMLRINGKRFTGQLTRVDNPALKGELKTQLESMAAAWIAPDELGPPPTTGPRDIWFFKVTPAVHSVQQQ